MIDYKHGMGGEVTPYIIGRFSSSDFSEFMASGADMLMLNGALGWDGSPGVLREIRDMAGRGIHILPMDHKFDVSILDNIGAIRYLYLGLGCHGIFDASRHDDLRHLRAFAAPKALKLDLHNSGLEIFACNGGDIKDPSILGSMKSLISLNIVKPHFSPDILPVDCDIESVDFYAWGKLKSLERLSMWPISSLSLYSCKQISNYDALINMSNLKRIFLDDCSPLPTARILNELPLLSEIVMQGTKFLDNDVSSILSPRLREFRINGIDYLS